MPDTTTFPSEITIKKDDKDKLFEAASRIYANMDFDPKVGTKEKPEVLAKKAVNYAKILIQALE